MNFSTTFAIDVTHKVCCNVLNFQTLLLFDCQFFTKKRDKKYDENFKHEYVISNETFLP